MKHPPDPWMSGPCPSFAHARSRYRVACLQTRVNITYWNDQFAALLKKKVKPDAARAELEPKARKALAACKRERIVGLTGMYQFALFGGPRP